MKFINNLLIKLKPINCGYDLIRLGGESDGGYLLPNDLERIQYCFSPGVSNITNFENDLYQRGIKSFMADYSVNKNMNENGKYIFDKKYLGCFNSSIFMTFDAWKNKYLPNYSDDLIMQMDIEGYEYMIIVNISENLLRQFRIMIIEFHFLDQLINPFCFMQMSNCFEKILKYFEVVHIHPNNCCSCIKVDELIIPRVMEFTFIRKDRILSRVPRIDFPHNLDRDNAPSNPTLDLPECWYNIK